MSDSRTHRGRDPRDDEAFSPPSLPGLREGASDLSWLLARGYAIPSALKLVGDRWSLTERQRMAIRRAASSDAARFDRLSRQVAPVRMKDRPLMIDGFNVVTTVESALGGGIVLLCRDQTYRDLAGIHGTYRRVVETLPALSLIGRTLSALEVPRARWLFDRPVSNSGRVRSLVHELAREREWEWEVDLVDNPDAVLKKSDGVIATSDSAILDRCKIWLNLARIVVDRECPEATIIDLSG